MVLENHDRLFLTIFKVKVLEKVVENTGFEPATSGDLEMYYQANERFHLVIYAASHNSFLYEETSNMQCRLAVYRCLQLRSHGRLKDSRNEHQGILDADRRAHV